MRLDIYHHVDVSHDLLSIRAQLDKLLAITTGLLHQGNRQMATTQELLDKVTSLAAAFAPLPAAIDALEAAVGAVQGIPAADQANIDAAFAALNNIEAAVNAAAVDAADGTAT